MLKNDIGVNSGEIWRLLLDKGALSIRQIREFTGYRERMIILALGWLAREDKINFLDKHETIYIELKSAFRESYY